jgi:DNA invertase Pin-like site-specific DNA recombinase
MNNNDGIEQVAIYTRVSTEDQAKEGFSLDAQLSKLQSFCVARGWGVTGEYIDDGHTGTNMKRPGYQQMFQDIDNWDAILVMKMDRIHRNSKNFMMMMEELRELKKEFVSMTESLDTSTAMGRFVMDIIQRIAQLESEQIGERTFAGMYQKGRNIQAGWMGHGIPFGYRVIHGDKRIEDERTSEYSLKYKSILIENPDEIHLIKQMYHLAHKGDSIKSIARDLNLPYSKVHYVLHNPFYAGMERYTDTLKKTLVKPLFTRKFWNQIQIKISRRICRPGVRKKPLQLPVDSSVDLVEIPKNEYEMITCIRHQRFKHKR